MCYLADCWECEARPSGGRLGGPSGTDAKDDCSDSSIHDNDNDDGGGGDNDDDDDNNYYYHKNCSGGKE